MLTLQDRPDRTRDVFSPEMAALSCTQNRVRARSQWESHHSVLVCASIPTIDAFLDARQAAKDISRLSPNQNLPSSPLLPRHTRTFHLLPTRCPQSLPPTMRAIPPRSCLPPARISCKDPATTSPSHTITFIRGSPLRPYQLTPRSPTLP